MAKSFENDWLTMVNNITTVTTGEAGDMYYNPEINTISISDGSEYYDITSHPPSGLYHNRDGLDVPNGELTVKGRNVLEELDIIKDLLEGAVIERSPAMEEEFTRLKDIAADYKKQLEKYKTFKKLKD